MRPHTGVETTKEGVFNKRKWLITMVPIITMGLSAPAFSLTDEEREARRVKREIMTADERQAVMEEPEAARQERRALQREKWENMTNEERKAARKARQASFEERGGDGPKGHRRFREGKHLGGPPGE